MNVWLGRREWRSEWELLDREGGGRGRTSVGMRLATACTLRAGMGFLVVKTLVQYTNPPSF